MRVLVRYSPKDPIDVYDGTRLRKSIKNCLEAVGVAFVEGYNDLPDVIHFISPLDEKSAVDARVPTLASALYCENDPSARYLEQKEDGSMALSTKATFLLKSVDMVLVPSLWAKNTLLSLGVTRPIEIVLPSTNRERFLGLDYQVRESFYRYYMADKSREHAFVKGDFDDEEGMAALIELAGLLPEIDFYFHGLAGSLRKTAHLKYKLNTKTPSNLRFCDPSSDDLYRSGLSSSAFYLSLSYRHNDPIGCYEAFSANIQVFRMGPKLEGDVLSGDLSLNATGPKEMAELIRKYRQGQIKTTIMAYGPALAGAQPQIVGSKLKAIYETLLKERNK